MASDFIKMTKDLQRAKSILKQTEIRLDAISELKKPIQQTLKIEGYYEVIKELITALLAS